jgi:hypothetical protein
MFTINRSPIKMANPEELAAGENNCSKEFYVIKYQDANDKGL